jgi:hypothetical protein
MQMLHDYIPILYRQRYHQRLNFSVNCGVWSLSASSFVLLCLFIITITRSNTFVASYNIPTQIYITIVIVLDCI